MAAQTDFSLITVSSDEDDDVVIQAGVSSGSGGAIEAAPDEVGIDQAARGAATPREAALDAAVLDEVVRPVDKGMLTTEEDLRAPMPFAGMQRIIMAVFLLLILAAVVYWFFIRPLGA